jgi:hypothetical protein
VAATTFKFPSITQAQILSMIAFVVAQLVAYGLIDGTVQTAIMSAAGTIIPAVWILADSMLRGKRAAAVAANPTAFHPGK